MTRDATPSGAHLPRLAVGELFGLSIRNLGGYPLRTFLTTLGIVFGVASVIVMLALGEGAQQEILAQIGKLGIQNVIVNTVKPPESKESTRRTRWISRKAPQPGCQCCV